MGSDIYKHFVVLAVLAFWPAAIYMVKKWKIGRNHSFSHHAASERQAQILFAIAISVETILYLFYGFKWFIPTFQMGVLFKALYLLIATGHLISGLVPETKGWAKRTHWLAAYAVAWLFIPTTFLIALRSTIPLVGRYVAAASVVAQLMLWVALLLDSSNKRHFLVMQAAYIATLPATLIVITYWR